MGGVGSNRWLDYRARQTVESSLALDISQLNLREIGNGCYSVVKWTKMASVHSISLFYGDGWIFFRYGLKVVNKPETTVAIKVHLVETSCHFGGVRRWFECPDCKRKVRIIYFNKAVPCCRKCLNLTYNSCSYSDTLSYKS